MTPFGSGKKDREPAPGPGAPAPGAPASGSASDGARGLVTGDAELDRRNMQILLDTIRAVNSPISLDEVLRIVVDKAIELTKTERGVLLLSRPGADFLVRVARDRIGQNLPADVVISRSIPKKVFETGTPIRAVATMDEDTLKLGTSVINLRLRAVMCAPLAQNQKSGLLGAIYVDSKASSREFTDADLALFHALAQQIAIALERAHLIAEKLEKERLQQTLEDARDIQKWFLSRTYEIEGFEVAAISRSLDEGNGDYYDFIPLEDGRVGVAIADVSGHGIGPALIMGRTQALLESLAQYEPDLDRLFEKLNAKIRSHLEEGRYVTLFFSVLNPKDRSVAYNNAGHAPTFLYRARTGEIEELSRTGLPIGLMDEARCRHREGIRLEPCDVLLFYTDGITETKNAAGELFGAERLRSALARLAGLSPGAMIEKLEQEAAKFAGETGRQDDMTIIALKAKP